LELLGKKIMGKFDMKKIIINGRFLIHRVTGVERYARELLVELDKISKPGQFEIAIPTDVIDIPFYKNIKITKVGKFKNILWEHVSFPLYVIKKKATSLNLCNVAPLINPGIVCIHDMKIKATPQYFSKKFLIWYSLLFFNATKRAKYIITVSKFSKSEIIKYYKVDEKKIFVVPNAWQHFQRIAFDENALNKYGLKNKKYYFSMSSLEPNKNFKWIIEVAKRNPKEIFAISGSINSSIFSNNLGVEKVENIKFLGYVSDEEAKVLMRDCKAFLYPTFYEGFGIPPLEAMSVGSVALVSDNACMREVFRDNVIYVNPIDYDIDMDFIELESKKESVLNMYSWEKSSKKILNILEYL